MKKIILITLILIGYLNADTLIVKGPTKKVGDRDFTYYCVDSRLYLESKNSNRDNTSYFEQVIRRNNANYTIPVKCTPLIDGTFTYE